MFGRYSGAMRASQFFTEMFGRSSSGRLVIWSPDRRAAIYPLADPETCTKAEVKALELSAAGAEVYFGCGLVDDKGVEHGRGKAANVVFLPGFWIDIDCLAPYRKRTDLPPTVDDAIKLIWAALPPNYLPTLIVYSGAGVHAYWQTLHPWVLGTREDRDKAELVIAYVQDIVRDEAKKHGWHVDKTSDVSRVLRVPGTMNWRDPAGPKTVQVLDWRGPLHDHRDFFELVGGAPIGKPDPVVGEMPAEPRVKLKDGDTVLDYVKRFMLKVKQPDRRKAVELLVAGKPFAPDGNRDNTAQDLTSTAAWFALEVKPDVIAEDLLPLFEPSLKAWATDPDFDVTNPPPDAENVLEKLSRNIGDAIPKRVEQWAKEDARRASLDVMGDKVAAAHQEYKAAEVMRGAASRTFRERIAGRTEEELAAGYTPEDIAFFAEQQHCTVEDFQKRWIIQHGNSYYVYVNGRYETPVPSASALSIAKRYLAPANLEWVTPKADGKGYRLKSLAEIVDEYGTAVFRVEASLHLQHGYLEPKAGVFHEAVRPVRDDLDPRFDPQIDTWLRKLGGENQEKLLDWLATCTDLKCQTCGLYLWGPPDTGKGLLAQGTARLWTKHGPPTELEAIVKGFNASLTKCPLVFCDEHLPRIHGRKMSPLDLRAHLGTSSRTLNRKHIAEADLSGCIRLMIAANNDRILIDTSEDNISADDLQANVQRFLVIHVSAEAGVYLKSIGGREGAKHWVDGDLIARHVLWLVQNRKVATGMRFLVEGEMNAVHAAAMTSSGIRGALCDFMTSFVLQPHKARATVAKRILFGNGKLLVSTPAVCEAWEHYIRYGRPPTTTMVGTQLKGLSLATPRRIRVDGKRTIYHDINVDQLLVWVRANEAGDPEEVTRRISAVDSSWSIEGDDEERKAS